MRKARVRVLAFLLACATLLFAAIAYVNTGTGNASGSASTVATAPTSHSAGNLIPCGIAWSGSGVTVSSVSSTAGDTYAQAANALNNSDATQRTDVWYATNSAGNASDVVTVTFSGNATNRAIICNQYSGVATSSAFDVGATGYNAGANNVTSGNLVTGTADEVIFAIIAQNAFATFTAGSSFTLRDSTIGAGPTFRSEDRIVSSTGTYTASATSGSFANFLISAATFKIAGGGGGGSAAPRLPLLGVGP